MANLIGMLHVSLPGLTIPLTLHPRLTVLAGLDPDQRAALAEMVGAEVDRVAIDPVLMDELEHAHAAVEASNAPWPPLGRRARRDFQAARDVEQGLLEVMGFASYNEALLAWLTPPMTVPMVVDDAVVSVEPDELLPLLEQLLAGPAQIIWATEDPAVVATAHWLGAERAKVIVLGRRSAPTRV